MFKLLFLPVRLLFAFIRVAGIRGLIFMALGVGLGMLIAPERGAVLRARLQARLDEVRGSSGAPAVASPAVELP